MKNTAFLMDADKEVTVIFAKDFSKLTLTEGYIVDSYPLKKNNLMTMNATTRDLARRNQKNAATGHCGKQTPIRRVVLPDL